MDCAEIKGQTPAEEQLEPLVILEEGDELDDFTHSSTRAKGILRVKKEDMEGKVKVSGVGSTDFQNRKIGGEAERKDNAEVKEVQNRPGLVMEKVGGEMEGLKRDAVPKEEPLTDTQPSAKLRPKDRLSPEAAQQKVISCYKNS